MKNQTISSLHLLHEANLKEPLTLLNKRQVARWVESLFEWLFGIREEFIDFETFENQEFILKNQLITFLAQETKTKTTSEKIAELFFKDIYLIYSQLSADAQTILAFDPAAKSRSEVILAYPGFFAITVYRITHTLWQKGVHILPRLLSEYVHSKTGIDIHPAASIGSQFFIDHGTGIVIGETAVIGNHVKIYQGVTLGALSVSKDKKDQKRHPTIQDNVIIYANATILGGETTIGHNSTIGGNVWITASIPPHSLVYHKSEIIVKTKEDFPEALNFCI